MEQVVLIIHLLIAVVLVSLVLMQQSEGGALGIGGGGGSGGFLTGRGSANLLTRLTAAFAAAFFFTSIALTWLATGDDAPRSAFDTIQPPATGQPGPGAVPGPEGTGQGGILDRLNSGQGLAPLPSLPNNN